MRSANEWTRCRSAGALLSFGPSKRATEALLALVRRGRGAHMGCCCSATPLPESAVEELRRFESTHAQLVPLLRRMLASRDAKTSAFALWALQRIDRPDAVTEEGWLRAYRSHDEMIRQEAERWIGGANRTPEVVVRALRRALGGSDATLAARASSALGGQGELRAGDVPALLRIVRSPRLGTLAKADVIGRIGAIDGAEAALPALDELSFHSDPAIADAAKSAAELIRNTE